MTPQHGYPQGGGAAGRGIVLVVVAIALGVFLLARGFDGSDNGVGGPSTDSESESSADNGDDPESQDEGDDGEPDPTATTSSTTTSSTTAPPPVTHPRGEVKVAAINGKGAPGLASAAADKLNALGFTTKAKNAVNFGMEESAIYYRTGYAEDAKAIAASLNARGDILDEAPSNVLTLIKDSEDVSDFHVFVVLAADDAIPVVV